MLEGGVCRVWRSVRHAPAALVVPTDDKLAFLAFTRAITGIDDRRKKIEAMVAGEDNEKKGDKKKK